MLHHLHSTLCRLVTALALVCSTTLLAQEGGALLSKTPPPGEFYLTSGGEWILSVPLLDVNGSDRGGVVRFAPFFNVTGLANYDLSAHAGLFAGLSMRNLGFIYDDPESEFRYKFRTYNAGLPVGIKLGRMHGSLFHVGYEVELPFNYKEKRFANERKEDKFNVWFSDRVEPFFHSVFMGFQGPKDLVLTLRYYLNNFHNTEYSNTVDNEQVMPYAGLNANLLSISLGFGLFNGEKAVAPEPDTTPTFRNVNVMR